jgi:putative ABC transport system ATP-binding protein
VELPMVLDKKDSNFRKEKVRNLLKRVGLEERMEHLPTQMSGGEQQRVTIARALVNDPLIILADEPTGELDTETTTNIIKIFLELKNSGESIIMVTHNRRIAEVADRIITLTDGEFISEKNGGMPLDEIYKS